MTIWLLISALLNPMQSMMGVVLLVKVGVSRLICHLDSSTDDTDMLMVVGSVVFCHLDSLTAPYRIINSVASQWLMPF